MKKISYLSDTDIVEHTYTFLATRYYVNGSMSLINNELFANYTIYGIRIKYKNL